MPRMAVTRALVVDDNRLNREMIAGQLGALGYDTVMAADGDEAWSLLEREGDSLDVVLLDRRMPRMDGMEVLARMKASPALRALPVVMQTAADSERDVVEGIKAGVFYYLTKPFRPEVLLSVTVAAVEDYARVRRLQRDVQQRASALSLLRSARFTFRTLSEAGDLATALAAAFPDPRRQVIGLSELMINAVEHGNLAITYEEKSALLREGRLEAEVAARLALPEYRYREVEVVFARLDDRIELTITDQGDGFDWRRYLDMDPRRVFDNHGRGIALSRSVSFDALEYRGRGNEVTATVRLVSDLGVSSDGTAAGSEPAPVEGVGGEARASDPSVAADGPVQARLVTVQDRLLHTHADLQAFRSRLQEDLASARRMQQDLLPDSDAVAAIQTRYGVDLDSHFETSSELGGDLFGVHAIDDHRFALWIVDFAGHGVAAALNTFRLHALLTEYPEWRRHPGEYLSLLGARLAELLPTGQYATAFYGVVDVAADMLRYAAAATPAPLFADMTSGRISSGDGSGLPLGITASSVYETREVAFPPGHLVFLYSDALLECGLETRAALGTDGVRTLLADAVAARGPDTGLSDILAPFLTSVRRPLGDDLSAIVCRRRGPTA